jgi:hypothetical protein
MITRGRIVRISRWLRRSSACGDGGRAVQQLEVLDRGVAQRELPPRVRVDRFAWREPAHLGDLAIVSHRLLTVGHRGGEEPCVEAQRLDLRCDPVREVHDAVGRQGRALGAQHVPERAVIGLAGAPVVGVPTRIGSNRPPVGRVRQQDAHLFECLANHAHPVCERRRRRRGEIQSVRAAAASRLRHHAGPVVRAVARLDLAAGEHEVAAANALLV